MLKAIKVNIKIPLKIILLFRIHIKLFNKIQYFIKIVVIIM
jgi:hypothetical protein